MRDPSQPCDLGAKRVVRSQAGPDRIGKVYRRWAICIHTRSRNKCRYIAAQKAICGPHAVDSTGYVGVARLKVRAARCLEAPRATFATKRAIRTDTASTAPATKSVDDQRSLAESCREVDNRGRTPCAGFAGRPLRRASDDGSNRSPRMERNRAKGASLRSHVLRSGCQARIPRFYGKTGRRPSVAVNLAPSRTNRQGGEQAAICCGMNGAGMKSFSCGPTLRARAWLAELAGPSLTGQTRGIAGRTWWALLGTNHAALTRRRRMASQRGKRNGGS